MIPAEQFDRIARALPFLKQADARMVREFLQAASLARIPTGYDVFVESDRIDAIALMISGVVRVYKIGESGREITLYRFGLGESCILTANAILSRQTFPAIATVERDAEVVLIPADLFRQWVQHDVLWQEFVFDLLSQRLSSVMALVDQVAFRRMDTRVAALLLERSHLKNPIKITHQEIAAELGSSREVISRILEDFAERGMIRSGRGMIELIDQEMLNSRSVV